jgi:hypothetical protein
MVKIKNALRMVSFLLRRLIARVYIGREHVGRHVIARGKVSLPKKG